MDKGSKKTKKLYMLVNARISEMESHMSMSMSMSMRMRSVRNMSTVCFYQ